MRLAVPSVSESPIDHEGRYTGWAAVRSAKRAARAFLIASCAFSLAYIALRHSGHSVIAGLVMVLVLLTWGGHRGAHRYADGFRDGAHAIAEGPPEAPEGQFVPWTDAEWADLSSNDVQRMRGAIIRQSFRQKEWERSHE